MLTGYDLQAIQHAVAKVLLVSLHARRSQARIMGSHDAMREAELADAQIQAVEMILKGPVNGK